ncbi:hypothetical protein [Erythrobacter donghaensis]|uniref:hypothetical protein n=1 Tax=Erythrobacter donghaensis TaxID=267135 RepID=UPI000A3AF500|nr:hypothetical protein [Erythrobacter donghaensis]
MGLIADLENAVGKPIEKICPNHFHNHANNHCAHFVSHLVGLSFTYNCVEYQGGAGKPGNIRVHEIFAQCPLVGNFSDADPSRTQLVFVTRKNNVELSRKWMGNIPQKHVGVYCNGHVYHYSNTANAVAKWTPERFLQVFQDNYAGDQGLFFGTIPGESIKLDVDLTGATVNKGKAFALRKDGRDWHARELHEAAGSEFFIGREVQQAGRQYYGIHQPASMRHGRRFRAADHLTDIDHWAVLLELTGHCESDNYFNLVNTYDRAKFTYGFYQLAAHTPNDNFVLLLRELLRLPSANSYFPELKLINSQVHCVKDDGSTTNLEQPFGGQLQFLMNFLNPLRVPIDSQEVLNAARLMHWTAADPQCRKAQVRISAEILQRKMSRLYSGWYNLDGVSDVICGIIADIHHQGRGSKTTVLEALKQPDPRAALLTVNSANYGSRNQRLGDKIAEFEAAGMLGKKHYDAASNEFVTSA